MELQGNLIKTAFGVNFHFDNFVLILQIEVVIQVTFP